MEKFIRGATLEKMLQRQIKSWEQTQAIAAAKKEVPVPFVTISREYGCSASSVAESIAKTLNSSENKSEWHVYDKELVNKIAEDHQISEFLIENIDTKRRAEMNELLQTMITNYPSQVTVYQKLVETIRSLSIHGRSIIIGRAGAVITRDLKFGTHIRFIAPFQYRVHNLMKISGIKSQSEARKVITKKDKERHEFLTQYIQFEASDPSSYDLTINIDRFSDDEIAEVVLGTLRAKGHLK